MDLNPAHEVSLWFPVWPPKTVSIADGSYLLIYPATNAWSARVCVCVCVCVYKMCISIRISLKFVPKGPNKAALVRDTWTSGDLVQQPVYAALGGD